MDEENAAVVYSSVTGSEIKLSPSIIRKFLVNGDASKVTSQEIMMFTALCQYQKLNPFLREAYLIKYGTSPATMVTGKEAFLKRAAKNPKYRGHETGISDDGKVAWAKVHLDGYTVPIRCEVDFDEYVGTKAEYKDGKKTGNKTINSMWASKPNTMLKKVALVQALREAFPEDFGGIYSPEEINSIHDELPTNSIDITEDNSIPQRKSTNQESIKNDIKQKPVKSDDKKKVETITKSQEKLLFSKIEKMENGEEAFCGFFGISRISDLPKNLINDALEAIDKAHIVITEVPSDELPSDIDGPEHKF